MRGMWALSGVILTVFVVLNKVLHFKSAMSKLDSLKTCQHFMLKGFKKLKTKLIFFWVALIDLQLSDRIVND